MSDASDGGGSRVTEAGVGSVVLELQGVTAGYGGAVVLRDVSIEVAAKSVVAVVGPNGAGKTTLLRVATGVLEPTAGKIILAGQDVTDLPPHLRAQRGFCHVPEGRGIFPSLTVRENIILSSLKGQERAAVDRVAELLPVLGSRLRRVAGSMSGGEQQMLALARALVCEPKVVAVDEASLGLSPLIVEKVYELLSQIVATGTAVILVEQYVSRALDFADHVYLLSRGSVVLSKPAAEVRGEDLFAQYLGEGVASPL